MAKRSLTHVWIEGLYERDADMGIAWAVRNDKEEYDTQAMQVAYNVDGCESYGTDCAEMVACYHALKALPEKASVVVHTGSNSLIRWMDIGRDAFDMRQHSKWMAVPPFRKAFEMVLGQIDRMTSYSFQYVRKNNEGMEIVRALAENTLWPDNDA